MKYRWNEEELKENIELLDKIYDEYKDKNTEKDLITKTVILSLINNYHKMIETITNNTFQNYDDTMFDTQLEELIEYSRYYYFEKDYNTPILNILLQSFFTINNKEIEKFETYVPADFSDEYILYVNDEFFKKMTPKYIQKEYEKAFKLNYNFLNIANIEEPNHFTGVTVFDCILKKIYINVVKKNELSDLGTLPHELFHYIIEDYYSGIVTDKASYYLSEVEGSFADLLFADFFKNGAITYNNFFTNYHLNIFQDEIYDLVIRNSTIDSLRLNGNIKMNKLNKQLSVYNLKTITDKDELIENFWVPQETCVTYALSYLAALDLFYIYLKDPEQAFYLLKNIRYFKNDDDIISILRRNHITFMDDNYTNLKKYIKTKDTI